MTWGTVELAPEVEKWLADLPTVQFARAAFYIEMLADQGPQLGAPCTAPVDGKLRELWFYLDRQAIRITYSTAVDTRIILLMGVAQDVHTRRTGGRSSTPSADAVFRRNPGRSGRWLDHE